MTTSTHVIVLSGGQAAGLCCRKGSCNTGRADPGPKRNTGGPLRRWEKCALHDYRTPFCVVNALQRLISLQYFDFSLSCTPYHSPLPFPWHCVSVGGVRCVWKRALRGIWVLWGCNGAGTRSRTRILLQMASTARWKSTRCRHWPW